MTSENRKQTYLVFGATGGIGSALSRRLAARGARLVLAGRREESLAALAETMDATTVQVDATDFDRVDQAFDEAVRWAGQLDGVANCVGSLLLKPAHTTTPDEYYGTMAISATSSFAIVRSAAKALRKGGGSIVLVASAAAQVGLPNHEAIAAAKGAVIGLTRSAAATYASQQIRVNAVAPGLTQTPLTERITSNDTSLRASLAMHPLGRVGQPEDVAAAMAWLLSPESSWVTGQILGVDGGMSALRSKPKA